MKILFLDHDGVICLPDNWGIRFKHSEGLASLFDPFDKKAVKVLNEIIEETDCEIVVSSDWKYHGTLEQIGEWYKINGIIKKPIDTTPVGKTKFPKDFRINPFWDLEQTRSFEIKEWLSEHPEVTHWVAVDDLNMGDREWGLKNFVHTPRMNEGIKQSNIKKKILKYLETN